MDPDGVRLVSVFSLMIEAWLSEEFAPEATESRTGVPASRVRQLLSLLKSLSEQEIEIPIEWTDWKGEKHQSMKGRPVSMHAMRGISAHSNGFQTCRSVTYLQLLLGSVDVLVDFASNHRIQSPLRCIQNRLGTPTPFNPASRCQEHRLDTGALMIY